MKIGFRSIGLIAAAAGLMTTGSVYANGAKGGGLDLLNLSGKRPVITEKATEKLMECPRCTSETKVVSIRENNGRVVREVPIAIHGCSACKTASRLVGHGKAKVEKWEHTCTAMAETVTCCAK